MLNATVRIWMMNDADAAFNDFMRFTIHGRDTLEQLTDANILVASGCYPSFPCQSCDDVQMQSDVIMRTDELFRKWFDCMSVKCIHYA